MITATECRRCGLTGIWSQEQIAVFAAQSAEKDEATKTRALLGIAQFLRCHAERCVARPRTPSQERPLP